ncbi:hypothetical protein PIB30_012587 [Stylosanthes scabra]|uniref:Uncharacterized protein n=1 Tax=Stylosanthes scabra TaxID=79078 RepID=A0ABU6X7S7_9FABA|nr:hypothetical protein [Stylosanthes scabra]
MSINNKENQQPTNAQAASKGQAPFTPPARVKSNATTSTNFRPKQPIRRRAKRKNPRPSEPPSSSQSEPQPKQHMGGPSAETMAAAGVATQGIFRFMETPGLRKQL